MNSKVENILQYLSLEDIQAVSTCPETDRRIHSSRWWLPDGGFQ
jgi:hypothetical protein